MVDVGALVRDMTGMLERLLGTDVRLEVACAPDAPRILADPGQVQQVLVNLAANARDAMPRGGSLRIAVEGVRLPRRKAADLGTVAGEHVLLAVTDTGTGMDPETLSHIFEPFFTTKGLGRGTGLGLATVYGIVEQSGGTVAVESVPGTGTTFRIYWPRVYAAVDPPRRPVPAAAAERAATVLMVEDQPRVRELVESALRRHGYRVLSAADAHEALELFGREADGIDLLITDVIMPDINGVELANRLRSSHPDLPTIFMSGYSDEFLEQRTGLGTDSAFLQKPFSMTELLRAVTGVLARP